MLRSSASSRARAILWSCPARTWGASTQVECRGCWPVFVSLAIFGAFFRQEVLDPCPCRKNLPFVADFFGRIRPFQGYHRQHHPISTSRRKNPSYPNTSFGRTLKTEGLDEVIGRNGTSCRKQAGVHPLPWRSIIAGSVAISIIKNALVIGGPGNQGISLPKSAYDSM